MRIRFCFYSILDTKCRTSSTRSKDEGNHPPLPPHTVGSELLYIPFPGSSRCHSQIHRHEHKSTNDCPVQYCTSWRCNNRNCKVNQALDKIVRADQPMEHWMLGHAVFPQGSQICMTVMLHTRSKDKNQATNKGTERWRLNGQVREIERLLEESC